MAKLSILPLLDQPLKSGNIPIHIRLSHAGGRAMMATDYSVSPKRIKDKKISDTGLNIEITNTILAPMMAKMQKIANIDQMSAREVMNCITAPESLGKIDNIDFLHFSNQHIEKLIENKQLGSARNFRTIVNALTDFTGRNTLYTFEVTLNFLNEFTSYLTTERKFTRPNQDKAKTYTKPGLSDQTINNYIKDFRALFNACREKFNDLDVGVINIPNYPFKKYKFRKVDRSAGFRSIEIDQLIQLINLDPETLMGRRKIARDMYLLSFYLIGINPTDLFDLTLKDFKNGRINYYRNKTKKRRADKAFISIQVPPAALEIIERYKGQERLLWLNVKYVDIKSLIRAVNKGLKELAKVCNIENESFTWYSARHTWASIARNECEYSLEDIGIALNHVSENSRVTEDYIKKDWSIIDKMNTKVLQKVFKTEIVTSVL